MIFDINSYFKRTFIYPIIILFIVIIFIVYLILVIKKRVPFPERGRTLYIVVGFLFASFFILFSFSSLRYGYTLVNKKASMDMTVSGEIQEIYEVPLAPRYYYNDNVSFASYIIINNYKYYVMNIGEFKVGDEVDIRVIKDTVFIIEIDYSD